MRNVTLAATLMFVCSALPGQAPALREPLDAPDDRWGSVAAIADGANRGAARFDGKQAFLDVGPCSVSSRQPFTLRCAIRTSSGNFSTPLMARNGEAVGISLVLGRSPGILAFEAWSWRNVSIRSKTRIDDGQWHRVDVSYDPRTNLAMLMIDGEVQSAAELGAGEARAAVLRLGDNIGARQPFAGDLDEVELVGETLFADRLASLAPITTTAERAACLEQLRHQWLGPENDLLRGATTADWAHNWQSSRTRIRTRVLDSLGLSPPPERRALAVATHGELVRDGVRVQRVSWNGIANQRATGWLWLPEVMTEGRRPAVLCPHGHWENGALHPVVQARCAAFAKFGWIALSVDSVHVEHVASGVNSVGAMTWHNHRAIDLLCARDDVDPARIGCTGASGGGQQTCYLMAVEDRIAAAAPIVMACYFREILDDETAHCNCNHAPRMAAGTDVPEMCAVFAPKPVMFGSVTGDWTRNFPREGLPELRHHWALLGGPTPRSRHANEGHNFDRPMRETVYGFLHDTLVGPAGDGLLRTTVAEPEFQPFSLADLAAIRRAQPTIPLDPDTLAREHLARRPKVNALADIAPRGSLPGLPIAWRWNDEQHDGWRMGRGPEAAPVPMRMLRTNHSDDVPYTVFVDPRGGTAVLAAQPSWLAVAQRPVLVDPRPYGEWSRYRHAWQRNGILLGCGEGYLAAFDLALACQNLPGSAPVHLVGLGEAGVVVLLAAHLCPRVVRIVTDDLGPNYAANGNRLPLCPEILRWRDLPELIRTLPASCDYVLGGAVLEAEEGTSSRSLCARFSAEELTRRLRPAAR